MAIYTTSNPVTVEEFLRIVPDGQKADLLDGVIYMGSPDTPESSRVGWFVGSLLEGFVSRFGLGQIFGSRSAFRLSSVYCPEPDIAFVAAERSDLWDGSVFQGPPDVAVEIVSDESIDRDYGLKRRAYEKAGVREYWILDLLRGEHTFLRLLGGRYRRVSLEQGHIFRSRVIPGFWLDIRWLTSDPLPPSYEVLQKIMASA